MNKLAVLEGLLFIVGEDGLSIEEISNFLEIADSDSIKLIEDLTKEYDKSNRGIRLVFLGNKYKLSTKEEHKNLYQEFFDGIVDDILTPATLETLAIIAYNQPITRIQIDEIRGVNSSSMLRNLIIKGFVEEGGKAEKPGRPNLYKTTNMFLDYFGLSTIDELPEIEEVEITEEEEKDLYESKYQEEFKS